VTEQLAGQVEGDDAPAEPATAPEQPSKPKRVSKWDRPPEPHDWRYYVGGLGKILITTGLLMFGFVAYQLWGTGIETARAQNKLENQFEELLAEAQTSTTAPTTVAPTTAPPATVPSSTPSSEPVETIEPSPAGTSLPPESAFPTTAPAPVEQNIPPIERGQALARLEIPRIDKDLIVVPGVSLDDLKKGPGHYPETPLPGQLGNASIAGHRTTFGEPFRHIDELEPGDQIIVTMFTGDRFVYEVASTEIVGPDDYFVVTTTDPNVAELTLTSCDPVYTARNRIAVHAFLVSSESDPVGEPTFYDLEANGNVRDAAGGDNPAVVPEDTDAVASSGDVATVDAGSTEVIGSSEAAPADTTPDATAPAASARVQDAFADGWFHDSGAWPQIALWGGALILIAIAVRRISRHFRHDSIGIAVGIIPFVICLYFFYQNVNRLLPPGF
jgi:sortase A